MIEKNYIVLAHNNPNQLNLQINQLDDGFSHFYVHIDKKADLKSFSDIITSKHVTLITDRKTCIWGDYSIVQATINCIRQIIEDNRAHYTILLSGQCFPIVNNNNINKYIEDYGDFDHIDISPIEELWPTYKERIEEYKINLSTNKGDSISLPSLQELDFKTILAVFLFLFKIFKTRKNIKPLLLLFKTYKKRNYKFDNYFGGSQWWALKYNTLKDLIDFVDNNKDYCDYHKFTFVPDEIFFHTIIKHLSLKNETIKIKPSLTYVNWTRTGCYLPVVFKNEDFDEIMSQSKNGKLFARKFDINYCGKIMERIVSTSDTTIGCNRWTQNKT